MAKKKRKGPYALIQERLNHIDRELHNHLSAHDRESAYIADLAQTLNGLGERLKDVEALIHMPFSLTAWSTLGGILVALQGYLLAGAFLLLLAGFGGLGIVWAHRSQRLGRFMSDVRVLLNFSRPDSYEWRGLLGHLPQAIAGAVLVIWSAVW